MAVEQGGQGESEKVCLIHGAPSETIEKPGYPEPKGDAERSIEIVGKRMGL